VTSTINARELRRDLARVVKLARQGQRFTVIYRSKVAFEIVPPGQESPVTVDLKADSLYGAGSVGSSSDGRAAMDHDGDLYS
jgi:antitoxin (DNA-binding transcriptional repressor) of toxin-antitoxin stability system